MPDDRTRPRPRSQTSDKNGDITSIMQHPKPYVALSSVQACDNLPPDNSASTHLDSIKNIEQETIFFCFRSRPAVRFLI